MRFWGALTRDPEPPPEVRPLDLPHLVDEGHLVAVSALRLAIKNGMILTTIRDGEPWSETAATEIAHRAVDALAAELSATAEHLAAQPSAQPSAARTRGRSRLARAVHDRDEAARLDARGRTLLGVVERLRATRENADVIRELVLRARDDTLAELLQARLIPRAALVALSDEEQREAIEGVKADLQLMMLEQYGGY